MRRILSGVAVLIFLVPGALYVVGGGVFGDHEEPGSPTDSARPPATVAARTGAVASVAPAGHDKQILFGDFHVHTTFSPDAFLFSLPMVTGEGAHPPADACDFARYCSALDFWSINDHAEGLTPRHWAETVESIRACNAVAQDEAVPDTVAFLGWEWTNVGTTPQNHYGHKNVVVAGLADDEIPARPIASRPTTALAGGGPGLRLVGGAIALSSGEQRLHDFMRYNAERDTSSLCPADVDVRGLPADCHEVAETPEILFRKLNEWGVETVVIPHGTTWGTAPPPLVDLSLQLRGPNHDPARQTLFEVFSGHGSGEVYRPWRAIELAADGAPTCPEPTEAFLPICWRAGEIIRARCVAAGESADECETRAVEARALSAAAGALPHWAVPGATAKDWLDAGQCRDCPQPAFNYRPGGSGQYALAVTDFETSGDQPRRYRFGFIGSSDNHFGRAGSGYKEFGRRGMTESMGTGEPFGGALARVLRRAPEEPEARARVVEFAGRPGFGTRETERLGSFLYTGGLVAVHAASRDRGAIWDAVERREVYGTSGPRILLWFDLVNGPDGTSVPMGGQVEMGDEPMFRARAVGSFEQKPGCPDYALSSLSADRVQHLCKGECYHPSNRRRRIERIDVIRIRPQIRPDEDVANLIDDPWRSFDCPDDPAGCDVTFRDADFVAGERDALYYVRAVEEAAPAVNGEGLVVEAGKVVKSCPGPAGADDDCLGVDHALAWASPIFVDHPAAR